MGKRTPLGPEAIAEGLRDLPGWEVRDGKLHREYRFPDFATALRFWNAAAAHAERLDHHPEWSNVYGRVTVDLVTHSAKGITALDLELARAMEAEAGRLLP
jgi:4a-hydroxytetrahydrobiopterin dehydratase